MADMIVHFLSPFVFFTMLAISFAYRNYVLAIISGLGFLSISVAYFLNPIPDISSLENIILSSIYFGLGAYLFIVASIEQINEYNF